MPEIESSGLTGARPPKPLVENHNNMAEAWKLQYH